MRQANSSASNKKSPKSTQEKYKTPKSNKSQRKILLTPLSPNHSSDSESMIPSILTGHDTPWSNKKGTLPHGSATPFYPKPKPQELNDLGLNQSQMNIVYGVLCAALSFIIILCIASMKSERPDSNFVYFLFVLAGLFVIMSFFFVHQYFRK